MVYSQEHRAIRLDLLRLRSELARVRFELAFERFARKMNHYLRQPRVPAGHRFGGRWTAEGADWGGPARVIRVNRGGGRRHPTNPRDQLRIWSLEMQLRSLRETIRRDDPTWAPPQSLTAHPRSTQATIEVLQRNIDHARARLAQIERARQGSGGSEGNNNAANQKTPARTQWPDIPAHVREGSFPRPPLGFNTSKQYVTFVRNIYGTLRQMGYTDAVAAFVGSSVTGYRYRDGTPFDAGRRSDIDLTIVSPSLFEAAVAAGAETRGRGSRTAPLNRESKVLEKLGLHVLLTKLEERADRKVSIMIRPDWDFIKDRPHYRIAP